MNEAPRRTLRELIARHGTGLCSDARRCEGLLRDLCGEHRREINILLGALRERVPLDLLAGRNSVPAGLLLTRLAKRLEEHLALTEEASRWAVGSWALALGVVTDAGLAEIEGGRRDAPAPHAEVETRPTHEVARPPLKHAPGADDAAANPAAPPDAPPPRRPQGTGATAIQPPPASRSASTRAPAPPATRGGSPAAGPKPSAPLAPRPQAPPQAADAGGLQAPATDPGTRGRRGRWRGCLVGCVLLLLLSVLLVAGTPFVINMLREEQLQKGPRPVQTR